MPAYNVVFRITSGPATGSTIPHAFYAEDGKAAFSAWYKPIKEALAMEVIAEGISVAEVEKLNHDHPWPKPQPLEERIAKARQCDAANDLTFPQDIYVSIRGLQIDKEGLELIGSVPTELRGLYLLGAQMSKDVRDEEKRRNILELGKVEYDNERVEFQTHLEVKEDPLFAGSEKVLKLFAKELETAIPEIAANEHRGRMFFIDEDWSVFTAQKIPYRDEEHRRQVEAGAERLKQLLGS